MTKEELLHRGSGVLKAAMGEKHLEGLPQQEAEDALRILQLTLTLGYASFQDTFGPGALRDLLIGKQSPLMVEEDQECPTTPSR